MDILTIANTIRAKGSAQYKALVPEATRTNIEEYRAVMLADENISVVNEFMSTFLNKVARQELITKSFENPLKMYKKGKKPIGDGIEEIYNNFLSEDIYDPTGADLLTRNLPDTKTVYHRMNRKAKYKVTVERADLEKAFISWGNLESYLQDIIDTLHKSNELGEYIHMRQLIASAVKNNAMVVIDMDDPAGSVEAAEAFIKVAKTISGDMAFPKEAWNAYLTAQSVDNKPIITSSSKKEQIMLMDIPTDVALSVDVLAKIFNASVAEFNDTQKTVVDNFGDGGEDIFASIVDRNFFQVFDDLYVFKSFENPEGLYDNYYLHVWQTLAYSILVNAVAFKKKTV